MAVAPVAPVTVPTAPLPLAMPSTIQVMETLAEPVTEAVKAMAPEVANEVEAGLRVTVGGA